MKATGRTRTIDAGLGQASWPVPALGFMPRKCSCGGSAGMTGECETCKSKKLLGKPLQRKLAISKPGDQYEQEADRVAEQVMRMPDGSFPEALRKSVHAGEGAVARMPVLQRAEGGADTPTTEGDKPKEEGSRCPSWRGDPQSISKRAGEFYARNHLTPPSQATVERIECELPIANGNYGCYVHFSDGLVLRVIVRETDIVVGTGPGPITTEHPPPATPLCFYEYSCPEGDLVLTVKKCQSARPSGSTSPPAVAQRSAASDVLGPMTAPPIVHDVLNSPGQPLDSATRAFFEPRFGHDFSQVLVHVGERAEQSARNVNAHAYTVGHDIVFGAGKFSPATQEGRRLLAHELTHTIQQAGAGAVTVQRGPDKEKGPDTAPSKLVDCDAKKDLLEKAFSGAEGLAEIAIRALEREFSFTKEIAAMRAHFGSLGSDQKATIIERYKHVKTNLRSATITCAKTNKKVKAGDERVDLCGQAACPGNKITLYPTFGSQSCPAGPVLLHEALHNAGACDDIEAGSKSYPPSNSEDNAYSYENFAVALTAKEQMPELGKHKPKAPTIKD